MSIFETKIMPSVNIDTGEIHLMVKDIAGRHYTEVMQTKDKATRAALIALGWTPPPSKRKCTIFITTTHDSYEGWLYREDKDNYLAYSYADTYAEVESALLEELLELENIQITIEVV